MPWLGVGIASDSTLLAPPKGGRYPLDPMDPMDPLAPQAPPYPPAPAALLNARRASHRRAGNEVTALPPSDATPTRDSIALPGVSVVAPYYSHPYTSGVGPKASSNGRVKAERYPAPPDYVMDIAMHPYTSGVGSKAGPNRALRVEHYEALVV